MRLWGLLAVLFLLEFLGREVFRIYFGEPLLAATFYLFLRTRDPRRELTAALFWLLEAWLRAHFWETFLTTLVVFGLKKASIQKFDLRNYYSFLLLSLTFILIWGALSEGLFPYIFERSFPARWGLCYLKFVSLTAVWYGIIFALHFLRKEEFVLERFR
ncbi:MAG: hypothetical protein DSZ24_02150 [Thermodesulfatator sp.]|nr:MAG: hypothetical protein DSZ24_02150 [Thermodesulfatator sp.]